MRIAIVCVLLVSTSLAILACGGSGNNYDQPGFGKCPAPGAACGGDLEGTWTITSGCAPRDVLVPDNCSSYRPPGVGTITGSLRFSGGVMTSDIDRAIYVDATMAPHCFGANDCQSLAAELRTRGVSASYEETVISASCSEAGPSECRCDVTLRDRYRIASPYTSTGTGSFATTIVPETGTQSTIRYCIEGGSLSTYNEDNGITLHATRQ